MMFMVTALGMLVTSVAAGLALASQTERHIAATYRHTAQLGYLVDGGAERVVTALEAREVWEDVPRSVIVGEVRMTAERDARTQALNQSLAARFPMGADTPRWRVVATSDEDGVGVSVWIADDPADRDGDPGADSNGLVAVRAEARAVSGALRAVEVHVARGGAGTRRLSWREVW